MISSLFHAAIYDPLYNGLIFFVGIIPTHDVGLAIIALTIAVRVLLIPLTRRASETQVKMRAIAPQIEELKQKYKDDREAQAKAMFAMYREKDVHPFAGILLLLVQLPILIALFWVFSSGGLPGVEPSLLYSFVAVPPTVSMDFLGFLDMSGHSIVLGLLAAATQFVYTRLTMGPRQKQAAKEGASFTDELTRGLDLQARYVLPATFLFLSFFVPNAAMLYLVTSNFFMIGQEVAMGRRF